MSAIHPTAILSGAVPPRDSGTLAEFKAFLAGHRGAAVLTASDGSSTEVPEEVYEVMAQAVDALVDGSVVAVAPVSAKLSTTQAAEVLGVSRPTLVKMLEDGKIPFEQLNVHRSVLLTEVLAFKQRRQTKQRKALAEMTGQAQEYGLYEDSYSDYAEALEDARHHTAQ